MKPEAAQAYEQLAQETESLLTGRDLHVGIMAGGGVKGAVTMAPLRKSIGALAEQGMHAWFGTSVGALHAAMLGSGTTRAEQLERLARTRAIYEAITGNGDLVRVPFPGGLIGKARSLLEGGGIYKFDGLRRLLREHVDLPGLHLTVAPYTRVVAVSLEQGLTVAIAPDHPRFLDYVIASSAAPAMAQAEHLDGRTWVDGGVTDVLPFRQAIAWVKQHTRPNDRITFHCFLTGPREAKPTTVDSGVDVLFRSIELLVNAQARGQIDRVQAANRELLQEPEAYPGFRLIKMEVWEPTKYGPPAYDFRPGGIRELLEHGETIAPSTGYVTP